MLFRSENRALIGTAILLCLLSSVIAGAYLLSSFMGGEEALSKFQQQQADRVARIERETRSQREAENLKAQEKRELKQEKREQQRELCKVAAACRAYQNVRLDCAAAGNLRRRIEIKMGDYAGYIDDCAEYDGGPVLPISKETPPRWGCFLLLLGSK